MKIFYDTEFIEDGKTIDLVSIGMVTDDGRELYAVSAAFSETKLLANPWLAENVWPHLPTVPCDDMCPCELRLGHLDREHPSVLPPAGMAKAVADFTLGADRHETGLLPVVELWADYGAYDHVALAQIFGTMMDLPEGMPMFTHDIQQLKASIPYSVNVPEQADGLHNALADARHVCEQWTHLTYAAVPQRTMTGMEPW